MRVLFVSGIDGFCHRYQVLHRAAALVAAGGSAIVRHCADPRLAGELEAHDVLFLYRVPATAAVAALQERARARGVTVVGAVDDLIFVDHPDWLPALEALPDEDRALWRAGVRRYSATLERCDAFVAPTEPLVGAASALGWEAHLLRNSVAPAELELARRARAAAAPRGRDVVLGYFSGTPSHDADLATIAPVLAGVLRAHPAVRLLLVGPVGLPPQLASFAERIVRRELVPWHALPALMTAADVGLAPLALERRFAAAKGEIKYLEAAALALPLVASPSAAYRHAIDDGRNGRLAASEEEWRAALSELVGDPAVRGRLGAAARADLERRWSEAERGRELLALLGGLRRRGGCRAQNPATAAAPAGTFDVEPAARVALEADASPAFPVAAVDAVSPPLAGGQRVVQRFRAAAAGLVRVDVHTVTYGQLVDRDLRLTLRRDDGTVVACAVVPGGEAPDRAWLALELPVAEPASRGRAYTFEVDAGGERAGAAVSFGSTSNFASDTARHGVVGPAVLDGAPLAAALVLRGFAAWPDALADAPPPAPSVRVSAGGRTRAPAPAVDGVDARTPRP